MTPDSFSKRLGIFVTANPWKTLLISVLIVMGFASGGRFLTFTNDYRVFFSEENPQLLAFEKVERTYTKFDNVLYVLAPKDGNIYTQQTVEAIDFLTEGSWQLPYSLRVDSLSNYQHSYAEGDDLIVEDLVDETDSLTAEDLQNIQQVAESEPLLYGQLISYPGHTAGVNVTIQLPGLDPITEVPEVTVAARALADEFRQKYPDIELYITGVNMLNNAFSEASQKDMTTLIPLSFLVILIMVGFMLWRWVSAFATFWIVMFSVMTAMGIAGMSGIALTPASISAPTIILTMAVADSVHVLTNYFHKLKTGDSKQEAMVESLRVNLQPIFLTSLTTAIGFLSMNFSDAPPFRDLGNITALGVVAAFFLSVTLLPAIMMVLPSRNKVVQKEEKPAFSGLSEFVISNQKRLLYGVGGVLVVLVLMIPRNELNDQFVEYFDTSIPFRVATDFASENLVGVYRIEYSLKSGEPGGISEPEFLNNVEAFAKWYRDQPGVQHVSSYTDIIKRLNKNMHGDDEQWYSIPDSRELSAQYLLLYEMSLPYGLDLNNRINVDKSEMRFIVSIENLTVNDTLALENSSQQWLSENAPSMRAEGTGPSVMFSHITRRNIKSMLIGTTVALVLISLILIVALRSVKLGLVSMIPNLMPSAMAFGVWGLTVGEVGLSLSIVTGMTLGIVVDDTVHFLSKYLRAQREQGLSSPDAVRYAFSTVGTALWVTSVVLIVGFLLLTLSAFKINASMGLMTAITIAFALIVDFFFLPPLLMKLEERKNAKTAASAASTAT
ncbi:MAG: putative RND superfamily exporter protein [Parasphingorhabdus sp.]|jgi:predicted RND superfamily exporter protein